MKNLFVILSIFLLVSSCSESESKKAEDKTKVETVEVKEETKVNNALEVTEDGYVREYYKNGELRIEGKVDENKKKTGKWTSYRENGIIWSENHFENGLKNGFSITYHPNGQVYYKGEFKDDIKIGVWSFYDDEGEKVNEKKF